MSHTNVIPAVSKVLVSSSLSSVLAKGAMAVHTLKLGSRLASTTTIPSHTPTHSPVATITAIRPCICSVKGVISLRKRRWVGDAYSPCTTSTGHLACSTQVRLTEPSSRPAKPPWPRLPMMSMSAPSAALMSTDEA